MKFSIMDLLLTTAVYAAVLGTICTRYDIFCLTCGILISLQIFFPIAVVLTHILFLDQRGRVLALSNSRAYITIKKIWLLSLIFWVLIACIPSINV